ncbi:MAG TPA: alpha/beta hydrolase [Thermoleophilaceae bacterium]|nr:alpha/beta hydrolase [Thermoleophilaceae bacterium]
MDIIEHRAEVAGIETFWRQAGDAPILYVHGNPNNSDIWLPFLARTGGVAMDLPGFGRSAKPAQFGYSIAGYGAWLEAFRARLGWDHYRMLVHDWGSVGLATAQAAPERLDRLVIVNAVPFLPGYRWHRFARIWRTPVLGELFQGTASRWGMRRFIPGMPEDFYDSVWDHFDHGTQRAVLKLYRSAPAESLPAAGERLGEIACPALVLWGGGDPYLPARFAHAYGEALGGDVQVEVVDGASHWPWIDRPELLDRLCEFLTR